MLNRFRQTGAFILVTIVFLMVAGGAMLYAMSNLSSVSSVTTTLVHNGNTALAAAQSGLKYCLYQLETGGASCPGLASPYFSAGISPTPCSVTISHTCTGAICTITSTAYCPTSTDAYRGAKKLTIQVHKTTVDSVDYYQVIPASRLVLPLP